MVTSMFVQAVETAYDAARASVVKMVFLKEFTFMCVGYVFLYVIYYFLTACQRTLSKGWQVLVRTRLKVANLPFTPVRDVIYGVFFYFPGLLSVKAYGMLYLVHGNVVVDSGAAYVFQESEIDTFGRVFLVVAHYGYDMRYVLRGNVHALAV